MATAARATRSPAWSRVPSQDDRQLGSLRDPLGGRRLVGGHEGTGGRNRIFGDRDRNEIHHDRRHHLMGAAVGLEQGRDQGEGRAAGHACEDADDHQQGRRQIDGGADHTGDKAAEQQLAFHADVEQAGVKGECDRKAGDQKRDHLDHRFRDRRARCRARRRRGRLPSARARNLRARSSARMRRVRPQSSERRSASGCRIDRTGPGNAQSCAAGGRSGSSRCHRCRRAGSAPQCPGPCGHGRLSGGHIGPPGRGGRCIHRHELAS